MTISVELHEKGCALRGCAPVGTVIARTNKATVCQNVDGSVAKQYHTIDAAERVLQDERSLDHIWQAMADARDADGWRYTVVRPLRAAPASGTIWLERAPGQQVLTFPTNALLDAEYHVGIWLATYHNRLFGEAKEGLIYADANVDNILVDPIGKVVTGLDPGRNWGQVGNRYQDVIRHVFSLIMRRLLLRHRVPLRAFPAFLHGYASATEGRMTAKAYATALGREARQQWSQYYQRSKPIAFAFVAGSVLLAPLYTIYVPVALARANKCESTPQKKGLLT